MTGIVSFGAYVPLWRLDRAAISSRLKGEKAVCNFDEDSITMAAAAAIDCLKGVDRGGVDGLFFASTTAPYKEKQAAGLVAAATDLRHNILTADFANSLKAGTAALKLALDSAKAGSAKQTMVAAADRRQGPPMSAFDQSCGDGAAALLVGNSDVIADLEASYSTSDEIMDIWRADGDTFLRTVHPRFVEVEGYERIIKETILGLMNENNLVPKDFTKIALYAPNARRATEVARSLGFDAKTQLQDGFFNIMGNTGVPYALMLFIAALEEAKPGDLILLASYGDGSDAFAFRVTDQIKRMQENNSRRGMKKHLETKRMIPDYKTYWLWRGLLNPGLEPYITHHFDQVAPTILWRDRNQILRLHGVKCKACGTVQYPAQRVCSKCHAKDQFEEVGLSDKKGTILTFSMDYVDSEIDTPIVVPIINFDGGGQIVCYMTDRVVEEVKAGMEVEMSFRKMFYRENMGLHNYFWKAVPIRA